MDLADAELVGRVESEGHDRIKMVYEGGFGKASLACAWKTKNM